MHFSCVRSQGLTISNPANGRLRKLVTQSSGDYKRCRRDDKRDFIWSLVKAFQDETFPKRRFLERSTDKTMPWIEARSAKVYEMIQKMFGRGRHDDHPEVVESATSRTTTPPVGVVTREDTKLPPRMDFARESNGEDGASLKTEPDIPVHEASTSSYPPPPPPAACRKVRKRRKKSSAGSMVRRRLESSECVDSINDNDVMCDGGIQRGADDYRGNAQLFELLESYQQELQPEGADERRVAESVVHHIRHMDPPGRFLKENADGKWYHIGTCGCRTLAC